MSKQHAICFFCSVSSFTTGMPISTYKLIQHFASLGASQVHAVFPEDGELPEMTRRLGARVWILPFSRFRLVSLSGLFNALYRYLPACLRLVVTLRRNHIELVHYSDFIDAPFYPAARVAGARSVAHLRMCIESRVFRVLYRLWTWLWVDKVVCISRAVMSSAQLTGSACLVYNPGPDPNLFNPDREFPRLPALDTVRQKIVSVADFREVKGHEHFVELAQRVTAAWGGAAQFVVVGGPVPGHQQYYNCIVNQISERGLREQFVILGKVPHQGVAAVLKGATALVHLPNYQEGFGGVILEAMMMRVPVVAFECGGVGECFTNGVSGFLVEQFDTASAALRVTELVTNSELRESMGKRAREEVLNRFSFSRHFAGIETVYNSL